MENDQNLTGDELQPAAGEGGDQKTVPLAALEDERGKRQALEERIKSLEDQNALYRANVDFPTREVRHEPEKTKEPDLFEGMDEGDVLTVAEAKKIFGKHTETFNKEKEAFAQKVMGTLTETQMMQTNSDYKTVITKHLPNVLKEKPYLRDAIKNSANPYILAYEIGKTDPEFQKEASKDKLDKDGQKIIENLNKPQIGNLGQGGGLDNVNVISNLSDDQLEEKIAKVKNK